MHRVFLRNYLVCMVLVQAATPEQRLFVIKRAIEL